jgi:demethylmenaquinone methyltransferase/2-methoxy-6-polyprenyl-1,4-benzoquinol methylase
VRALYDLYFSHILPTIGRIVSRDKTAYTYLNKSVKGFCWGETFVQHLQQAGFKEAQYQTLTFGIATVYTAIKL